MVLGHYEHGANEQLKGEALDERIDEWLDSGMRPRDVSKALALETKISASEMYRLVTARRDARRDKDEE